MATASLLPLITAAEYLRSSYEPDAEFVDGHIEERPVGERDHGDLQRRLLILLSQTVCERYFTPVPELRVQVTTTRFRVPDLTVVAANAPREQIVLTPPILCIEVLSPEDTMTRTLVRVRDFLAMGVPEVSYPGARPRLPRHGRIVDPELRTVLVCAGNTLTEHTAGSLSVPGTPVSIRLSEVFSVLGGKNEGQ